MKLIAVLTIAAFVIPCHAVAQSNAQVFSGTDVNSQLADLVIAAKASGTSGVTLGDYKSHAIKLSVRTSSGGAEVHAHYDDIFVVTKGRATLITGGTVVNPKTDSDGETKGSGIQNGKSQTIVQGDIVHIPAGTPHQLTIASDDIFGTIAVKVKEAP
jgi:mannose-6-phosphate isomerase-like protein (cupin superfamily)